MATMRNINEDDSEWTLSMESELSRSTLEIRRSLCAVGGLHATLSGLLSLQNFVSDGEQ